MTVYERLMLGLIAAMAIGILILAAVTVPGCVRDVPPTALSCSGTTAACCSRACQNLARLGCPGWRGSPGADDVAGTGDDVTCMEVCDHAASQVDIGVDLKLDCVAAATTCEEVERCPSE